MKYSASFHRKFRSVHREIDQIRSKIDLKTGIIFTSHIYSQEELLKSDHHQKIYSICEKIGSDVDNWYNQGKLNEDEEHEYYEEREEIEDELNNINIQIQQREPTWWESAKGALNNFVAIVMKTMPDKLKKRLLTIAMDFALKLPGLNKVALLKHDK